MKKITWLSVPEAAEYLGVTERWMRRQIDGRHIRFNKLGGKIRFRQSDLDELIAEGEHDIEVPMRPVGRPRGRRRRAA
jgi:excisionase family DNA binding protein